MLARHDRAMLRTPNRSHFSRIYRKILHYHENRIAYISITPRIPTSGRGPDDRCQPLGAAATLPLTAVAPQR